MSECYEQWDRTSGRTSELQGTWFLILECSGPWWTFYHNMTPFVTLCHNLTPFLTPCHQLLNLFTLISRWKEINKNLDESAGFYCCFLFLFMMNISSQMQFSSRISSLVYRIFGTKCPSPLSRLFIFFLKLDEQIDINELLSFFIYIMYLGQNFSNFSLN